MDIIVNFDGTCVIHKYPECGSDIKGAANVLRELVKNGNRLILWTMRPNRDNKLTEAINWFRERDILLYGIQTHPEQNSWTDSPKAHGHLIIDDTSLGMPLKINTAISKKPFVDWHKVGELLIKRGAIKEDF